MLPNILEKAKGIAILNLIIAAVGWVLFFATKSVTLAVVVMAFMIFLNVLLKVYSPIISASVAVYIAVTLAISSFGIIGYASDASTVNGTTFAKAAHHFLNPTTDYGLHNNEAEVAEGQIKDFLVNVIIRYPIAAAETLWQTVKFYFSNLLGYLPIYFVVSVGMIVLLGGVGLWFWGGLTMLFFAHFISIFLFIAGVIKLSSIAPIVLGFAVLIMGAMFTIMWSAATSSFMDSGSDEEYGMESILNAYANRKKEVADSCNKAIKEVKTIKNRLEGANPWCA